MTDQIETLSPVHFSYETEKTDQGEEKIYFHLENYPTIKFSYENIRFGDPDEDEMVPVLFDLDVKQIIGTEEFQIDEEFENQTKGLLVDLFQTANQQVKVSSEEI